MDPLQIVLGAAGSAALYLVYAGARKGVPASWAWLKSKWNSGKAELAQLEADASEALTKAGSLETSFATLKANLEARISALEQALASRVSQATAAPAPAPQPAPAAPAPAPAPAAAPASA